MTSKEQQIKNSFLYLLPTVVGNLVPLLTLPIFTRILTKEDYGVWGLAQVYAIFMSGLANFGLIIGYERNFFQYREPKRSAELLYSTLFFVTVALSAIALLTFLFKAAFSRWIIGSAQHADILFWSFCTTGILNLKTYYLTYYKNTENAKAFARYTIDESLLGMVFSLFLVAYLRIGVIGLVWGQLLASLIIFTALSINFLKIHPIVASWDVLKDSLKLSYPLTPRIFFGVIGNQFDKYMIGLMASIGGVGIYSIGQKVANMIFTYMTAIQNVYSPQVYKRMFDLGGEGGEAVGRYLTPFAYLSVAAALIVALFSEEIIGLLTPVSYHGAIDIVIVLSMFYASMFFGKQPQLIYAKKTHITSLLTIMTIALNILVNIPFIMRWGAIGAAWGTLLAGLISGAISFLVSQHYYKIKWEYRKISAIFLLYMLSSVTLILLRHVQATYAVKLTVKFVSAAYFFYLGVRIKIITRENFEILRQSLSPLKVFRTMKART